MQQSDDILTITAGKSSGYKVFRTGFTPVQVIVYNNSNDATLYYLSGSGGPDAPANAREIPPGKYIAFAYTANAQTFTLWWESDSPIGATEYVVAEWADEELPFNYAALSQDVNITNGNITVSISGTGNTVALAAGTQVSIAGSVTVTGTVNIGTAPTLTVQISGSGNTVSLAAGTQVSIAGNVTVQGTVNIGTAPTLTVAISGSNNTVQLAANTTVNIGGTATVQWTSTGPVSVTDLSLPANDLVLLHAWQYTVTNWPNGATNQFWGDFGGSGPAWLSNVTNVQVAKQFGIYDGIVMLAYFSTGGSLTYNDIGIFNSQPATAVPIMPPTIHTGAGSIVSLGGVLDYSNQENDSGNWSYQTLWRFPRPQPCNIAGPILGNNSGGNLSGILVIYCYGIRSQAFSYNPTSAPAQMQASSGSFDTLAGTNGGSNSGAAGTGNSSLQTSSTLIASGNYFANVTFADVVTVAITNGGTGSMTGVSADLKVYNGSQLIWHGSVGVANIGGSSTLYTSLNPGTIPFGSNGVPNNGITATVTVYATTVDYWSMNWSWGGITAIQKNGTPTQKVSVIS